MEINLAPEYKMTCEDCKDLATSGAATYCFKVPANSLYLPSDYLKGNQSPEILIIAINPRGDVGSVHEKTKDDLIGFSPLKELGAKRFYSKYKGVSEYIFNNWCSADSIVAETDLYKCFSPNVEEKIKSQLIENCFPYLQKQLISLAQKLKIIICNGFVVSKTIKEKYANHLFDFVKPYDDINFSYCTLKIVDELGFNKLEVVILFIPFLSGRFPLKKEKTEKVKHIIENDILKQKFPEIAAKLKLTV